MNATATATAQSVIRTAREAKGYGRVKCAEALSMNVNLFWKIENATDPKAPEAVALLKAIKALPAIAKPAKKPAKPAAKKANKPESAAA